MILQTQEVLLPESHTLNCLHCNTILLQINFIDQFLKPVPSNIPQKQSNQSNATLFKYYVLSNDITLSQIKVNQQTFLYIDPEGENLTEIGQAYHTKIFPYDMMYLKEVNCSKCGFLLGFKIQTITKDMVGCYQLLGRIIISVNKVKVWAQDEDITNILLQQFEVDQETQAKYQESEQINKKKEEGEKKQGRKSCLKKDSEQKQKMNMKRLRKSLESQIKQKEEKELVEEIISTIDFFSEVLDSLDKRVRRTEEICLVLKKKVEKLVPTLRKQ